MELLVKCWNQKGFALALKEDNGERYVLGKEVRKVLDESIDDDFCEKYKCDLYWDFDGSYHYNDGTLYLIFKTRKRAQKFIDNIFIPKLIETKLVNKNVSGK